ncbi:hypothetical protein CALCODRAFT_491048 [Calocera cornea HHB12733]|uniref:Uncharacterized protein n=1 Tax=Calocera cornea HHB12733 TaxID=1353952 RepID=A0A165J8R3_9BASI|nr:hypothetical protein CALCODRAFT_491048 [Calocera cornea HHB12733]
MAEALSEMVSFDQQIAAQALYDVESITVLISKSTPKKGNKLAPIFDRLREAVASSSSRSAYELSDPSLRHDTAPAQASPLLLPCWAP